MRAHNERPPGHRCRSPPRGCRRHGLRPHPRSLGRRWAHGLFRRSLRKFSRREHGRFSHKTGVSEPFLFHAEPRRPAKVSTPRSPRGPRGREHSASRFQRCGHLRRMRFVETVDTAATHHKGAWSARADIQPAGPLRTQQRLVSGETENIHPQRLHVDGPCARSLGCVHDKRKTVLFAKAETNARSVRLPVTLEACVTTTRRVLGRRNFSNCSYRSRPVSSTSTKLTSAPCSLRR